MKSRRLRKTREDPTTKLARSILPAEQCDPRSLAIRDVANFTDADQRHSIRAKETKTVRRLTRVERLVKAGVITQDQAAACEWYASIYELGFQTIGRTANYCGAGGGGFGSTDLLARYKEQSEARENYHYARLAIPRHLLGIFEAVVLGTGQLPRGDDKLRFSLAAFRLQGQIGHLFGIAA